MRFGPWRRTSTQPCDERILRWRLTVDWGCWSTSQSSATPSSCRSRTWRSRSRVGSASPSIQPKSPAGRAVRRHPFVYPDGRINTDGGPGQRAPAGPRRPGVGSCPDHAPPPRPRRRPPPGGSPRSWSGSGRARAAGPGTAPMRWRRRASATGVPAPRPGLRAPAPPGRPPPAPGAPRRPGGGRPLHRLRPAAIPGAEVTFSRAGAAASVRPSADGSFRFEPPEPGRWQLAAASAPGHVPFAPEWGHSPVAFDARPGERVSGVTVWLRPEIATRGRSRTPRASRSRARRSASWAAPPATGRSSPRRTGR